VDFLSTAVDSLASNRRSWGAVVGAGAVATDCIAVGADGATTLTTRTSGVERSAAASSPRSSPNSALRGKLVTFPGIRPV